MKKFIGFIEQYFIKSIQKLFHDFLSQMMIYIKEKIELPKIIRYSLKRFIDITSLGLSYNFKEEIILKYMACISINLFINKIDS